MIRPQPEHIRSGHHSGVSLGGVSLERGREGAGLTLTSNDLPHRRHLANCRKAITLLRKATAMTVNMPRSTRPRQAVKAETITPT